jgi:hypothetical protein
VNRALNRVLNRNLNRARAAFSPPLRLRPA